MTPAELLIESFGRVRETALAAVDGLTPDDLAWRPGPAANPVGWLVWHLARVQDDHVSDPMERRQLWIAQRHVDEFALPYDPASIGYGHTSEEVGAGAWDAVLLARYLDAVHRRTTDWVATLSAGDLDVVVDERWDPPVTLAVRLVSVVDDGTQHAGQAAYVRGLLGR